MSCKPNSAGQAGGAASGQGRGPQAWVACGQQQRESGGRAGGSPLMGPGRGADPITEKRAKRCSHAFQETNSLRRTMQIVEGSLLHRRAQGRVSS